MKKRTLISILSVLLVLICIAGFLGYRTYRSHFITLGEVRYRRDITHLDLSDRPADYLNLIPEFTGLKTLDLRGSGLTVDEYDQLHSQLPDCRILWDIPFQGNYYPLDTRQIEVGATLSSAERLTLGYFPQLETVQAAQCNDYRQLDQLRQELPQVEVEYFVPVCGKFYRYDTMALILSGCNPEDAISMLPYLPRLQSLKFVNPQSSAETLLRLRQDHPQLEISWHMDFHGIMVDNSATSLDFTGIRTSVEEVEALLPYLPNLTRLDLSDSGISNEALDALNKKYENIRIVWAVYLNGWFRVKTDITTFMPVKHNYYPRGNGLQDLRYCTDIIALDVGHMNITNCDFVAYMPHLQYLLMADTPIRDLTPLTGLKELIYLEIFMTSVSDFSPLVTCTSLQDLNVCWTYGKPDEIKEMTWLKNLWWCGISGYGVQLLHEALPDTRLEYGFTSSTGGGWRQLENYYAQRDLFGMRYMKG